VEVKGDPVSLRIHAGSTIELTAEIVLGGSSADIGIYHVRYFVDGRRIPREDWMALASYFDTTKADR